MEVQIIMRILIVEDETNLAEALSQILTENKYVVDKVDNGRDGLDYALSDEYQVIVLDLMLPKLSGFEVLQELRRLKNSTPVILLTARDELESKIKGLDFGADDYMTKPFVPDELLARIRAISRRKGEVILEELSFHDLTLVLADYQLKKDHKSVRLGYKEFEVLKILMSSPDHIVPKEQLILKVWGAESGAEDNNVEAYISFLRKKFNFLKTTVKISTIRKVGYKLEVLDS